MRNLVPSAVLFDAFQLELISRGRFGNRVIFNILRLILLVMLAWMSRTVLCLFLLTYLHFNKFSSNVSDVKEFDSF